MATVTKTVDKTLVNGSEVFVYTINVSYSGLTQPAQNGKLVDFFPDRILYILPQPGGQLVSISENPTTGGTNVEFNFGQVTAGTSLSFTVACKFGPGRVENDSFTNAVKLYADDAVVASGTAPTVNLQLEEKFNLLKIANIKAPVRAGQVISFRLRLKNEEPGSVIQNVVIQDVLPPELIAVSSVLPVGNDTDISGFSDSTYDGLKGSWSGNTLNFTLPSYHGGEYSITFQARVAEDVVPGSRIRNVATWTVDGKPRKDAVSTFSVYKDEAKIYMRKDAPLYGKIGDPILYGVSARNTGTVILNDFVMTDTLPPEVDITKISFFTSDTVVPSYDLFVETSELPGSYKPVAGGLSGNSEAYDLTSFIPAGHRVLSVRAVLSSMNMQNITSSLQLYGIINDTATENQVIVNRADIVAQYSEGEITANSSANTTLNGKSFLDITKSIFPKQSVYYPLDELQICLAASAYKSFLENPVFADLLPLGLDYMPGNDYITFYDRFLGKSYDSRQPDFSIPMPKVEVLKNYKNTGRTLVRYSFQNFTLMYQNFLNVYFGALVTLNPPNSFENYGYLGNPGNNTVVDETAYLDSLDLDGDSITNEQIAQSNLVSGTMLTTSEFSLEKWVKGNLSDSFSKASSAASGGDITYELHVTNNQDIDLTNIELVDILPYVGDTGVILNTTPRGSQFNVYATDVVTAKIVNILGDPVDPNPGIKIEYSASKDPVRFNESDTGTIGTGSWSLTPPEGITSIASVRITTDSGVILKPYERLIVTIHAKAPVGVQTGKIAYNSYAVRADKVDGGIFTPMNPAEPNKVSVRIASTTKSSIGDFVWLDANADGKHDQDEIGVNDITVELYDASGAKIDSTVTSNDNGGNPGYYSFTALPAGQYQIKFIPSGDYSLTIQDTESANGSRPNQTTGLTEAIILGENEMLDTVDAGVVLSSCPSRKQAVTDLIESVALEQTALSHILNAEGEKIQKAKQLNLENEDLLQINASVKEMVDTVQQLELVLHKKLELFECGFCGRK